MSVSCKEQVKIVLSLAPWPMPHTHTPRPMPHTPYSVPHAPCGWSGIPLNGICVVFKVETPKKIFKTTYDVESAGENIVLHLIFALIMDQQSILKLFYWSNCHWTHLICTTVSYFALKVTLWWEILMQRGRKMKIFKEICLHCFYFLGSKLQERHTQKKKRSSLWKRLGRELHS